MASIRNPEAFRKQLLESQQKPEKERQYPLSDTIQIESSSIESNNNPVTRNFHLTPNVSSLSPSAIDQVNEILEGNSEITVPTTKRHRNGDTQPKKKRVRGSQTEQRRSNSSAMCDALLSPEGMTLFSLCDPHFIKRR